VLKQQYARVPSASEEACDPIWTTAARPERMKLLKSACLTAADEAIRSAVEQLGDEIWDGVLDAVEAEISIIVQRLAEPGGSGIVPRC
jgi:hypothetical protein